MNIFFDVASFIRKQRLGINNHKALLEYGFVLKKCNQAWCTCHHIWINKEKKVVFKSIYLANDSDKIPPHISELVIPTLFLGKEGKNRFLCLQPLAKRLETNYCRKVCEEWKDSLNHIHQLNLDIHLGNIMSYQDRPVLIDW